MNESINQSISEMKIKTNSRYFSSDDFSNKGIPDKNNIIKVVKIGESIAIHSIPSITFIDMMNIPHHKTISPK
mgnify:CR=1 FL=1